jgi:hypothetical protein
MFLLMTRTNPLDQVQSTWSSSSELLSTSPILLWLHRRRCSCMKVSVHILRAGTGCKIRPLGCSLTRGVYANITFTVGLLSDTFFAWTFNAHGTLLTAILFMRFFFFFWHLTRVTYVLLNLSGILQFCILHRYFC